ncbi:hypothetical protein JHK87_005967 [Glycine soja]|nr:hypothetical protein JHK87_005967 [Glycine soja]
MKQSLSLSIIFPFIQPKKIPSTTLQPSKLKAPTQASSLTHLSLSTTTPPPSKTSFKSTNPLHAPLSLAPHCPHDPSNVVALHHAISFGSATTSVSSTMSVSLPLTTTPSLSSPSIASTPPTTASRHPASTRPAPIALQRHMWKPENWLDNPKLSKSSVQRNWVWLKAKPIKLWHEL